MQAPLTQAWFAQLTPELQAAVRSQVCTALPEHWVVPGVQVPMQPPFAQLWLHGTGGGHDPAAVHVWTPLLWHSVELGAHTPVQAPIAQA